MTCESCVAKVKSELLKLGDVIEAEVHLAAPQATISMQRHIPLFQLQFALSKAGNYTISEADGGMHIDAITEQQASGFKTYKPILLIGAYLSVITVLVSVSSGNFSGEFWMSNFMAGFFLVFSFFKLLDLKAFADSYASYDIIAKRWLGWGFIYAFIELLLGMAFLLRLNPLIVNGVAFAVMGISIIGVLKSVMNQQKIQCACLGVVFNLPMSTVTILEDGLMIVMSGFMIFQII